MATRIIEAAGEGSDFVIAVSELFVEAQRDPNPLPSLIR
jgi:hypothetical protein